jgi:glycerol-3-phosphate dehydrogenase subunit B
MKDFSPQMAATGLKGWPQFAGKTIAHELAPSPYAGATGAERDMTALDLASFLDTPEGFEWLATALANLRSKADAVLLPSILGTRPESEIHARLERRSGRKLIELFSPPPSVTGLRMQRALMGYLREKGVNFVENAAISRAVTEADRCLALATRLPDRERLYRAAAYIIATGGLFSAGIQTKPGEAREAIFDLPLDMPADQDDWSRQSFFGPETHPFATLGVTVNSLLQPVGRDGKPLFTNVRFAGRILGGYDFATEKSGSGVALATGHYAGSQI